MLWQTATRISMGIWMLLSLCFKGVASSNYLVPYEETEATFVDYPNDATSQAFLATRDNTYVKPIPLILWTTPIHFRHPLLYFLKGIVHRLGREWVEFQPNFFLHTGLETACRKMDERTGQEYSTVKEGCGNLCTNHQRYCAASLPSEPELATKISGTDIVEESLRRLCVWAVYGKGAESHALQYFRYVNDLLFQQCEEPFGRNCTNGIMSHIGIVSHFIDRCMGHTHGLYNDTTNTYLQEQVDQRQDLTLNQIPALRIGDAWYTGEQSSNGILEVVCGAFPTDQQPVACDFCKACNNVRYCLWFLECDGTSFQQFASTKLNLGNNSHSININDSMVETETSASYQFSSEPTTVEETGMAGGGVVSQSPSLGKAPSQAPTVTFHDVSPVNEAAMDSSKVTAGDDSISRNSNKEKYEALRQGILIGLAAGLMLSFFFGCRHWQARLVLQEFALEQKQHTVRDVAGLDAATCKTASPQKSVDESLEEHEMPNDDDFFPDDEPVAILTPTISPASSIEQRPIHAPEGILT